MIAMRLAVSLAAATAPPPQAIHSCPPRRHAVFDSVLGRLGHCDFTIRPVYEPQQHVRGQHLDGYALKDSRDRQHRAKVSLDLVLHPQRHQRVQPKIGNRPVESNSLR
jgi:hypothetical protein